MHNLQAGNALETALIAAQAGKIQPSQLFGTLYAGDVLVLINKEVDASGGWDADTGLLILNGQGGFPVVAMFTAPERMAGWAEQAPAFKHGLTVQFRWIIQGIADGVGIVLNPGSAPGLELPPAIVADLKNARNQSL